MKSRAQEILAAKHPAKEGIRLQLTSWISSKELSREFWVFFTVALCYDLGIAMFMFLFNLFLLDIGFNERQLGMVTGAMTLGGVTATLPIGFLAQRVGLHRVLLASFLLTPTIFALRTMVIGERAQVAIAFVAGMSICSWAVCFAPTAAKLTTEKNRTFAFSLLFSVGIATGGVGGLIGGLLPGWLQSLSRSMQPVDAKRAVLLLCCVIMALGVWPLSSLKLPIEPRKPRGQKRFNPFLLRFLPAVALWSLAAGSFIPFATVYLSRQVHVPLAHIGFIFLSSQLAQVLAILMAPAIFRLCGLVKGIVYMQIATAIALGGLAAAHFFPLIVTLYLGFTAFHWMGGPGIYSLLMNRVPEAERSEASAANSLVTSLCQAIASPIAGAAYVAFGYPLVMAAIAGIALLAAALFWLLLRDPRQTNSDDETPIAGMNPCAS